MNKDDKWIESLKERLDSYREPAPTDLWNQLEKELDMPKAIPFYRRYGVAAAITSLLLLSSAVAWWINSSPAGYVQQISKNITEVTPVHSVGKRQINVPSAQSEPALLVSKNSIPVPSLLSGKQTTVASKESVMEEDVPSVCNHEMQLDSQEQKDSLERKDQTVNPEIQVDKKKTSQHPYAYNFNAGTSSEKKTSNSSWSIGVAMGNAPMQVTNDVDGYQNLSREHQKVLAMTSINEPTSVYSQLFSRNLDTDVRSKTKHKMPITFGVSVRWNLNERWALESGLTYTKLSSELWSGTEKNFYESEQKLHYLGIPLKGSYRLWENKLFSVYVSAGGAVEKCISGELNTVCTVDGKVRDSEKKDVSISQLQWSVNSAVGAQIKLTSHLGLYIEPGLSYYFKDGSSVETIHKEHPLNFNLQTGLRLSY